MAGYYKNEVEMPDDATVFFGQYHVLDGEPRMYTGPSMTVAEMKKDQRIGSLRYCNVGDRIKSNDEVTRLREQAARIERERRIAVEKWEQLHRRAEWLAEEGEGGPFVAEVLDLAAQTLKETFAAGLDEAPAGEVAATDETLDRRPEP